MSTYYPLTRGFVVTSPFGNRDGVFHWGTDFGREGGSGGNAVHAVRRGTVVMVGPAQGFGSWVVVDSPDGGTHVYGHVVPEVQQNQFVEAGQRIAHINPDSNTNGGVAPHLHLEWHRFVWVPPGPDRLDPWVELQRAEAKQIGEQTVPGTVFGIDISNHQGNFDFAAAKREGFTFATHKILEIDGNEYPDNYWPRAKHEMQQHFPGRWGGYVFCHKANDPRHEADRLAFHAGSTDFPLQIDYESKYGGNLDDLWARYNEFVAVGFTHFLPVYIPRWYWAGTMGSPDLTDFPLPVWNSDYGNNGRSGDGKGIYPGAGDRGWVPFGRKPVAILQYTERGWVAGQAVDCNAIRDEETAQQIFGKVDDMAGWETTPIPTQYTKDPDGTIRLATGDEPRITLPAWEIFSWLDGRVARTEATVNDIHRIVSEHTERIGKLLEPPK